MFTWPLCCSNPSPSYNSGLAKSVGLDRIEATIPHMNSIFFILAIHESGTSANSLNWPSRFSFHSDTLLSPLDTAKMFPEVDQLTRQTTSGNGVDFKGFLVHWPPGVSCVQIRTVLSCEHDAK